MFVFCACAYMFGRACACLSKDKLYNRKQNNSSKENATEELINNDVNFVSLSPPSPPLHFISFHLNFNIRYERKTRKEKLYHSLAKSNGEIKDRK